MSKKLWKSFDAIMKRKPRVRSNHLQDTCIGIGENLKRNEKKQKRNKLQ